MARNTMTIRKDGVTILVAVYSVMHLTDYSTRAPFSRPCLLNRTDWFDETAAREFAREESEKHPSPQRFVVYSPDEDFVVSYQCGKELSPFVIEG